VEIPVIPEFSRLGDAGRPLVIEQPDSEAGGLYRELGEAVVREVSRIKFGAAAKPQIAYVKERGIVVTTGSGETVITPADLRRRCRCALCVEEFSGRPLLKPDQIPDSIYPTAIQSMGNYAVAVQWSDGHTSSIYPYEALTEPAPASK
jgi:DUF971 family protein